MASSIAHETVHYDTIIIGAGISGLACASRLHQDARYRSDKSLLVLEARNRIGGRINSVHVNGCRLDTGANWVHGVGTPENPNPLMSILPHKRYKELSGTAVFQPPSPAQFSDTRDKGSVDDDWVGVNKDRGSSNSTFNTTKPRVIPSEVAGTMYGGLWSLIGELHKLAESKSPAGAKSMTMLQAIQQSEKFRETSKNLPEEYKSAFRSMPAFIEDMEAGPLAAQSAEQPQYQAGLALSEFAIDDFQGDQVFLQDGYIAIINELATDLLKHELIKIGVIVKKIAWDQNPIVIETNNGSYSAAKVVCTLPLGVLQHSTQRLPTTVPKSSVFHPELPQDKSEAITSLGFGTLDKIFLTYSSAWWQSAPYKSILEPGIVQEPFIPEKPEDTAAAEEEDKIPDSIMGFTHDLSGLEIHSDGTTTPGLRALSLINLNNITGFPALCAFVSCENATYIESLSDEAAGALLHRALTSWFGREVPAPEAVHVTRWAQDQFSRGSYSHMITGLSEITHRVAFQSPLVNRSGSELRFAGEHTSRNHFATAHGALISGWREADALLGRASSGESI